MLITVVLLLINIGLIWAWSHLCCKKNKKILFEFGSLTYVHTDLLFYCFLPRFAAWNLQLTTNQPPFIFRFVSMSREKTARNSGRMKRQQCRNTKTQFNSSLQPGGEVVWNQHLASHVGLEPWSSWVKMGQKAVFLWIGVGDWTPTCIENRGAKKDVAVCGWEPMGVLSINISGEHGSRGVNDSVLVWRVFASFVQNQF